MYRCDVLIVGAGPGGGHCARLLAKKRHKVLLLERYKDFGRNNFSSAGAPKEILSRFDLPETLVGSWWNKFIVVTTDHKRVWQSDNHQGCVLDFKKMRQFLADEVSDYGGEVWLGCRYIDHCEQDDALLVTIKNNLTNTKIEVMANVLVDATGATRRVMCGQMKKKPLFTTGTGVEHLIEVDEKIYNMHAKTLTFLLGHQWMPGGYSWVFPMEQNILKVGAGVYNKKHELVKEVKPLNHYIELLIQNYLQVEKYRLIDVHGETLKYNSGLQDIYNKDRIIAIGGCCFYRKLARR